MWTSPRGTTPTCCLLKSSLSKRGSVKKEVIDLDVLARATERFRADPQNKPRFDARVEWQGGYRTTSRLGAFAGPNGDEPVDYAGSGTGPAPEELLLAAAAQCLLVGIAGATAVRRIAVKNLVVRASGRVNLPAAFGVTEGHPGFETVELTVEIDAEAELGLLESLVQAALARAPVPASLARPVSVTARLA